MTSKLPSLAALLAVAACASTSSRPYVWVDDLAQPSPSERSSADAYLIHPGDTLSARVWGQAGMSGRARVREDGRISVLFLNDVDAAGLTPAVLSEQLQTRLKDFLAHPVVSVAVEEIKAVDVAVLGEVAHPGSYLVTPGAGLLQVLAAAGGLTDYANTDRVFVLRHDAGPARIRFHYQELTRAGGRAGSFVLRSGDVVVAE